MKDFIGDHEVGHVQKTFRVWLKFDFTAASCCFASFAVHYRWKINRLSAEILLHTEETYMTWYTHINTKLHTYMHTANQPLALNNSFSVTIVHCLTNIGALQLQAAQCAQVAGSSGIR